MGMMECSKCGSPCCTRYSTTFGYICDTCINELRDRKPTTFTEIKLFMNEDPEIRRREPLDLENVFEDLTNE